jgi:hypothetical protein
MRVVVVRSERDDIFGDDTRPHASKEVASTKQLSKVAPMYDNRFDDKLCTPTMLPRKPIVNHTLAHLWSIGQPKSQKNFNRVINQIY